MEHIKETNGGIKAQIIEKNEEVEETKKEKNEGFQKMDSKKPNKVLLKFIIPICITVLILFVLSIIFALINTNSEKIISGVTIDKIQMKGLSKEEAKALIKNKIEEKLKKEIKINVNNEETTFLLSQIELEYLVQDAIDNAYNVGRNSNIFVNNFNILKTKVLGLDIKLGFQYNEEMLNSIASDVKAKISNALKEVSYSIEDEELIITKGTKGNTIEDEKLKEGIENVIKLNSDFVITLDVIEAEPKDINIEKIYEEVHREAQDAYYTKDPFQVYPEVKGIDFNIDEAKEILKEDKEEYIIPLTITNPKKTVNDIGTEAFPDLLSSFTTRYDESNVSRSTNLKIAVSKLNGKVIMPGEVFSYNKALGKRTAAAGYKEAAGYEGGKVVQMIGGGICQISSTLYDAVVYANLKIVERHNHAFKTSYIGPGKDATVVYGALDFQFKNTRKYPITIKASAKNGIAKIDFYGIKEETEYEIEISTTVLNSIPFTIRYEDDPNLAEGVEKVTQNGMNGCKSITYKIYKLNGKEVSREVLSTDTYDPMNKYITRGTKKTVETGVESLEPTVPEEPVEPETPEEPENPTPEPPETPENPTPGGEEEELNAPAA